MKSLPAFWRRFLLALAAVIAGNGVYFAVMRFLPSRGQHAAFRLDLGLLLDFWLCLIIFNLLLLVFRSKR